MVKVHKKLGFIGAGNMTQAFIKGLLTTGTFKPEDILVSSRNDAKLARVAEKYGIIACRSNEEVVDQTNIIILATKPQDLSSAVEPIAMSFDEGQIVLSLAAGITLQTLSRLLPEVKMLGRLMPNTPIRIQKSVIGFGFLNPSPIAEDTIQQIFSPLGLLVPIKDDEGFQAITIAASSGVGFLFELMQYWQDWIEGYGFDEETAKKITVQTFVGAALLAEKASQMSLLDLQSQVVSKKGTTEAGLKSMQELEIERLLRYSFEKAVMRDKELADLF